MAASKPPRIVVVDGTNTLYRAFFAIPGLRAPDGTPTNAALGFVNMLQKTVREERPDHLVVVFDARGKTFRHEMYGEYKAGRDAQPEDLSAQIPLVRELVDAYRYPVLEVKGYEADDVIATLVARAPKGAQITVVSTDKDLMQLVDERVSLADGIRDRRYGPAEVEARFGVPPAQLLDLRALVGDPSDNIPGVKGIGEKGAAKLIGEWGSLDALLEHVDEVKPPRAKNALSAGVDAAKLSRELATLRSDTPLPGDWSDWKLEAPDAERLRELFTRLGFTRLLEGLDDAPAPAANAAEVAVDVVSDRDALEALAPALRDAGVVPMLLVADGTGLVGCRPVGLALALGSERAAFVALSPAGPGLAEALEALAPLLTGGDAVPWLADDTKRVHGVFAEHGLDLPPPAFDVGIAGHLLDSTGARTLPALALQHLGREVASFEDLAGRGAKAKAAAELPLPELSQWAGETVCTVAALREPMQARLARDELAPLFDDVERPLACVLSRMERSGVRVDEARLDALSSEYESDLATLETEIYALAGEEFLVSSPKQLQRILFEKLELPPIKKTKTGFSTDEGVLEQLAAQHELPGRILAYRHLSKLKNTYVDALPPLVDERTGRIHPTFNQLGAATGRMSATNPNVQNIPIRTEEGIRIREAFVPAEGQVLLSADYSQVELRILAHFSGDESLQQAFPRRRRHPPPHRGGGVGRGGGRRDGRPAGPREGGELRDHLWALGLRPGQPAEHRQRRGPGDDRHLLRPLPGRAPLHRRHDRAGQGRGLRAHLPRPSPLPARPRLAQPHPAPGGGAHGREHRHPGHPGGPHQEGHAGGRRGPDGALARRPDDPPGARRAGLRGTGGGGRRGRRGDPHLDAGRPAPRGAPGGGRGAGPKLAGSALAGARAPTGKAPATRG